MPCFANVTIHRYRLYAIITLKVVTTVLGAIILVVGLPSHFFSSWLTHNISLENLDTANVEENEFPCNHTEMNLYQFCQLHNLVLSWGWSASKIPPCPDIAPEQYFVIVAVISFVISLTGLLLLSLKLVSMDMCYWQLIDIAFHGIFSVLLLAAGIAFIYSANKIAGFASYTKFEDYKEFQINLRTHGKIIAGSLAITQAVLFGLVAALVGQRLTTL